MSAIATTTELRSFVIACDICAAEIHANNGRSVKIAGLESHRIWVCPTCGSPTAPYPNDYRDRLVRRSPLAR